MTRVTHRTIQESTLANLQRNLTSMSSLQEQLSTGRRINRPSDDPTGTVSALQVRAELRTTAQHARSADDGLGWLNSTDAALQTTSTRLIKAKALTLQAANTGSMSGTAREAIAIEITGIRDDLLAQANTRYNGRSIFAGTSDERYAAYAQDVPDDSATPGVDESRTAYTFSDTGAGVGGTVERQVASNTTVRVDSDGRAIFGEGAQSVFQLLTDIAEAIKAPVVDDSALAALMVKLDERMVKVSAAQASVGARTVLIENAKQAAVDRELNLKGTLSDVESIDLPKTIVNLQTQEVAYKAALGATAKVLQPSLLDFLR